MEFLQQAGGRFIKAGAGKMRVTPLAGDASTRRYYRLCFEGSLSPTLILMELGKEGESRGELFCGQQRLFAGIGLPVPRVFLFDRKRGYILLSDCGDITLQQLATERGAQKCRDLYRQAIDRLLELQAATLWADKGAPAFNMAFDEDKFTAELEFFADQLLTKLRGFSAPPPERALLSEQFRKLSRLLAAQPRCLTHRDYHSRNLMVKNGELEIIDFQDARLGPCQYDLASLLYDSYVQLPPRMIDEMLAYYLRERAAHGLPPLEEPSFYRFFSLTCVQRNLKALGTFAYQAVLGNPAYLPCIPPTLAHVRRNIRCRPETRELGRLLSLYLPELEP